MSEIMFISLIVVIGLLLAVLGFYLRKRYS